MADPTVEAVPINVWTKVATNVTSGFVWILETAPKYYQTYRMTGEDAPTGEAEMVGIVGEGMSIAASAGIDVYVMCKIAAGSVRVDV